MKKSHKIDIIYGIGLSSTSRKRVLRFVRLNLEKYDKNGSHNRGFLITTPNPEHVLMAVKNSKFKDIINRSDLAIPDGTGLVQAVKFLGLETTKIPLVRIVVIFLQGIYVGLSTWFNKSWLEKEIRIIPGRVVFMDLIKLANKKEWRVVLLGDDLQSAQKAAEVLKRSYKKVKLTAMTGPNLKDNGNLKTIKDREIERDVISTINSIKPHLVFVAFRAPIQEIWSDKWLPKLNVGGMMVVGGTLDYVSGKAKLPPAWMEKASLEWLYRLITQPKRLRRILIAFPVFPAKMFWYKITKGGEK
ncbi:WecB/TagA/CpsF family glycosyltransferase [Patescibacteria group bacterium]